MNIRQAIIEIEYNAIILRDLLSRICADHFELSCEGAQRYRGDKHTGSYWWLNDHYDSAAAMIKAAYIIAETAEKTTEQLLDSF